MATVGSLGGITFNVSSRRVLTFSNFSRQGNTKTAEHEIIAEKSNMEFTGLKPEEISFDVQLFSQLNASPEWQLKRLRAMRDKGQAVSFMLGGSPVSQNRWIITSLAEKPLHWAKRGKMKVVTVSITLKEYRVDSNLLNSSTPWGSVADQISEVQDTVAAYESDALDVLDQVEDVVGDPL